MKPFHNNRAIEDVESQWHHVCSPHGLVSDGPAVELLGHVGHAGQPTAAHHALPDSSWWTLGLDLGIAQHVDQCPEQVVLTVKPAGGWCPAESASIESRGPWCGPG